jgi:hypothetical protein
MRLRLSRKQMIAKRITSRAAKPRMARLVKYVVAAQGQLDPRSWTRTADYVLCSGISTRGEKVGGVRVTNCNTSDPAAATTLIEVTQAANTRSKTDKTYHLVFSFPPGEEPDLKTLHAIEDQLVAAIGYADHQRISAVHIDTDHLHVHVAINKVHPKGFQNIEPYYDKKKLMETCERLEIEYGLTRTNHGLDGREPKAKVKERQAQAEIHGGIETITGLVARDLAPRLKEAKDWKEVNSILAEHGLQIKQRGAGLVIGSGKLWVKASQCDRGLSFKAMTDRLGTMESVPPAKESVPPAPYEPRPRRHNPLSAAMFEQYQQERLLLRVARENGLKQLEYEAAMMEHRLKKLSVAERLIVKAGMKGSTKKAALAAIKMQTDISRRNNWNKTQADRQRLFTETHSPNWSDWLIKRSKTDITALSILRDRQESEKRRGNCVSSDNVGLYDHVVVHHLTPTIDRKGNVTYRTSDGGMVIDRNEHVQCFKTTAMASKLALELAAERFQGQTLIIEGTESFQKEIAMVAKQNRIKVRFTKPAPTKAKMRQQSKENEAEL